MDAKHFSLLALGTFYIFVLASSATYLALVGPTNATLYDGEKIYLGKVGPGESFFVLANASTTNSSGVLINKGWSTLKTISLPSGWSSQASLLYEDPMRTKITVSPTAANGTYEITLRAINIQNLSKLGNLTIYVYVNVTPDVFNVKVSPSSLSSGVGQPANFYITINNTGLSDDPFFITASNLPAWNLSESVIAIHSEVNTFAYPVFVNEPGVYKLNITVGAATSPLVQKSYPADFTVAAGLINDYNAVGQGAVLSPIIFEPAYSLMDLLSALYNLILNNK